MWIVILFFGGEDWLFCLLVRTLEMMHMLDELEWKSHFGNPCQERFDALMDALIDLQL
jgi:hypothetical protein